MPITTPELLVRILGISVIALIGYLLGDDLLTASQECAVRSRFERIQDGMSDAEVRELLGEPFASSSTGFFGLCAVERLGEGRITSKKTWCLGEHILTVAYDKDGLVCRKDSTLYTLRPKSILLRFRDYVAQNVTQQMLR